MTEPVRATGGAGATAASDAAAATRVGASLRRTLLAGLLLPLLVLVPLSAALLYRLAVSPSLDALDRALTDTAVALTHILAVRDGRPVLPISEQTDRALRADLVDEVVYAVGDGAGGLLHGDAELLSLSPRPLQAGQWRFFDAKLRQRAVRVAAHGAACGADAARVCRVVVAESLGKRSDAQRAVALAALAAALLLASTIGLLAWWVVQRGLRPLQHAAAEIETRSLQRLDPVDVDRVPREAASFVLALNGLLARLRVAASAQRAFVEDAAHQLRTPLATLRLEAAQARARPHPPDLQPALDRLHAAAERGSHLVQQLLTLARADGAVLDAGARERTDLAALAAASADDWLPASLAVDQDLGYELAPAWVDAHPLLLRELLGNLVHNAVQHAGRAARITVRTGEAGAACFLEVEDDGPGVPADEQPRLWERFRRGSGAASEGSGLGLAIVRDIARLHGGDAAMRSVADGRGLIVRVTLPGSAGEPLGDGAAAPV